MMTRLAHPHKAVITVRIVFFSCLGAAMLSACGSVPGESTASGGVRRDVTRRVIAQAHAAAPDCKNQRVSNTEVVELHPDGRAAMERWTVEQCGALVHYRVIFPPVGKAAAVQVRAE